MIFNETNINVDLDFYSDLLDKFRKDLNIEDAEFSVILVDNEIIRKINKEYRKKDAVTDVISFALEDEKDMLSPIRVLGDIYISLEKAEEQAALYQHSFKRELSFLIIHGLLHLLGYDHQSKDEEEVMFELQKRELDKYEIIN